MFTAALFLEVLVSLLLVFVVLMQASKGGGLAGSFGSSNMGAVFGVRRTSDVLAKSTQVLATIFIVLALAINLWLLPHGQTQRESVIQTVPGQQTLPPTSPPSGTPIPSN